MATFPSYVQEGRMTTPTKHPKKKLTPAETAYRDGVRDGRGAEDFGVDAWAYGPYADEYGRGVRDAIREAREGRRA